MSAPNDDFQPVDPSLTKDKSTGPDTQQNDYVSRPGQNAAGIPVQKDSAPIEDPIDPATADSDAQLAADDKEAINPSNIIESKTRGAKPSGGYREPSDEEGLPGPDDGTSRIAQ